VKEGGEREVTLHVPPRPIRLRCASHDDEIGGIVEVDPRAGPATVRLEHWLESVAVRVICPNGRPAASRTVRVHVPSSRRMRGEHRLDTDTDGVLRLVLAPGRYERTFFGVDRDSALVTLGVPAPDRVLEVRLK
jgi:hypothetical protein